RPGGILQQWVPATVDDDAVDVAAITRSLRNSFPYVRAFPQEFGIHYLCSDRPIVQRTAEELVRRMPGNAVRDLTEWDEPSADGPLYAAEDRLGDLLRGEVTLDQLIAGSPDTPALTDDRPINEYYVVRNRLPREHIPSLMAK